MTARKQNIALPQVPHCSCSNSINVCPLLVYMSAGQSSSGADLSAKDRERRLRASLPEPSNPQSKRARAAFEADEAFDELGGLQLDDGNATPPPRKRQKTTITPAITSKAFREPSPLPGPSLLPGRIRMMRDDSALTQIVEGEEQEEQGKTEEARALKKRRDEVV